MLPEIAAEALRFLSRRDLDKACAVSKWLDALITQRCAVYPLRPVHAVDLLESRHSQQTFVNFVKDDACTGQSFSRMDEAVHFAGSVLRHSFVEFLLLGDDPATSKMALFPDHWTTLIEAMRSGAVQHLFFRGVDLGALGDDSLHLAIACRGLQSLIIQHSVLPSGFVTDDLIRASAANAVHRLHFWRNNSDALLKLSEDAVLDFCFTAKAAPERHPLCLMLDGSEVTETFLAKFIEVNA